MEDEACGGVRLFDVTVVLLDPSGLDVLDVAAEPAGDEAAFAEAFLQPRHALSVLLRTPLLLLVPRERRKAAQSEISALSSFAAWGDGPR